MQHHVQSEKRPLARTQHHVQSEVRHLTRMQHHVQREIRHLTRMHHPIQTEVQPLARLHQRKTKMCRPLLQKQKNVFIGRTTAGGKTEGGSKDSGAQIGNHPGAEPGAERVGLRGGTGKKAAGIPPWMSEPFLEVSAACARALARCLRAYAPAPANNNVVKQNKNKKHSRVLHIFTSKLISFRLKLCFLLKPRLLFDPLLVTS